MTLADFIRLFPLRAKNIAWFCGAGTSASTGVPTAYDMIWDFKRRIYCADQGYNVSDYSNLSSVAVRKQIQSYFDSQVETPELNSPAEYSYYFEKCLPHQKDRSEYIARMVSDMKPSFGHKVMAVLMRMGELNFVATTNFDKGIENAAATIYGNIDRLHVANIENNTSAISYLQDRKLPCLIKAHGDYHSKRLKNTNIELQEQDKELREALKQLCVNQGLAVIGYSGRDNSIMDVFEEAVGETNSFPNGLFWFRKGDSPLLPRVEGLITKAKENGIEAELVESETFDDTFAALIKGFENVPSELQSKIEKRHEWHVVKPLPETGKGFPVIRLNALPIVEYPTVARRIECSIGGVKEVYEAILSTKAEVLAIRKKEGVIGFGADTEFEKAFSNFSISQKGLYQITERPLFYEESMMKELLLKALCRGLTKDGVLKYTRRGSNWFVYPNPKRLEDSRFERLRNLTYKSYGSIVGHQLFGSVPETSLKWLDAVQLSLSYHFSSLYLLINPVIIAQKTKDIEQGKKAGAFVKEQMARRLNEAYNGILDTWIHTLMVSVDEHGNSSIEAFDKISGVNASFIINQKTLYARRR